MTQSQESDIVENIKLAFYVRQLIIIEKQIDIHKRIHYLTPTKASNNIQSIAIPKDETLNWNNIPKKSLKKNGR